MPGPKKQFTERCELTLDKSRKAKLQALAWDRGTSTMALLREAIDGMPEPRPGAYRERFGERLPSEAPQC